MTTERPNDGWGQYPTYLTHSLKRLWTRWFLLRGTDNTENKFGDSLPVAGLRTSVVWLYETKQKLKHIRNKASKRNDKWDSNVLWVPLSNSMYFALSSPVLYSLPLSVFFSPRLATTSQSLRICSLGTISSLTPLSMSIGVVAGISGIFDAESHFWWHKKERGPRTGSACGTRLGREVNVFSRIKAFICPRHVNFQNLKIQITISNTTLVEFRLARSIATAPPIDCPYRIFKNSRV